MSIASEITRLQNAKAALKSSIEAKGVTVEESATLDTYHELVDLIPTGGGDPGQNQISINGGIFDIPTANATFDSKIWPWESFKIGDTESSKGTISLTSSSSTSPVDLGELVQLGKAKISYGAKEIGKLVYEFKDINSDGDLGNINFRFRLSASQIPKFKGLNKIVKSTYGQSQLYIIGNYPAINISDDGSESDVLDLTGLREFNALYIHAPGSKVKLNLGYQGDFASNIDIGSQVENAYEFVGDILITSISGSLRNLDDCVDVLKHVTRITSSSTLSGFKDTLGNGIQAPELIELTYSTGLLAGNAHSINAPKLTTVTNWNNSSYSSLNNLTRLNLPVLRSIPYIGSVGAFYFPKLESFNLDSLVSVNCGSQGILLLGNPVQYSPRGRDKLTGSTIGDGPTWINLPNLESMTGSTYTGFLAAGYSNVTKVSAPKCSSFKVACLPNLDTVEMSDSVTDIYISETKLDSLSYSGNSVINTAVFKYAFDPSGLGKLNIKDVNLLTLYDPNIKEVNLYFDKTVGVLDRGSLFDVSGVTKLVIKRSQELASQYFDQAFINFMSSPLTIVETPEVSLTSANKFWTFSAINSLTRFKYTGSILSTFFGVNSSAKNNKLLVFDARIVTTNSAGKCISNRFSSDQEVIDETEGCIIDIRSLVANGQYTISYNFIGCLIVSAVNTSMPLTSHCRLSNLVIASTEEVDVTNLLDSCLDDVSSVHTLYTPNSQSDWSTALSTLNGFGKGTWTQVKSWPSWCPSGEYDFETVTLPEWNS